MPAATVAASTTTAPTEAASLATPLKISTGTSGQARQLLAYLYEPTRSPWVLILTLARAVVLGGLVVFMGLRLVWQRWFALRGNQSHEHNQAHDHSHSHDHDQTHNHAHGTPMTTATDTSIRTCPPAEGIKLSNLLAMGVSGGLVPCPEALGISNHTRQVLETGLVYLWFIMDLGDCHSPSNATRANAPVGSDSHLRQSYSGTTLFFQNRAVVPPILRP